jgi:hypothetical protein
MRFQFLRDPSPQNESSETLAERTLAHNNAKLLRSEQRRALRHKGELDL